ncbi:MAG: hypothetical protein ACK559_03540, partial [bacterium]
MGPTTGGNVGDQVGLSCSELLHEAILPEVDLIEIELLPLLDGSIGNIAGLDDGITVDLALHADA